MQCQVTTAAFGGCFLKLTVTAEAESYAAGWQRAATQRSTAAAAVTATATATATAAEAAQAKLRVE